MDLLLYGVGKTLGNGWDVPLSSLIYKEFIVLLVSNKAKGWVSVQRKPGNKVKETELSLEAFSMQCWVKFGDISLVDGFSHLAPVC